MEETGPKMKILSEISLVIAGACLPLFLAGQRTPDMIIDREIKSLVSTYENLHASPELSMHEEKTAAFLSGELKSLGYEVTDHVGRYEPGGGTAFGVVAVMRNGKGPAVLVRSDIDALPVVEKTGLPYASKVIFRGDNGQETGVMHACGHDVHMTCLLGTAKVLSELRDQWSGTLILVGQPAEEMISGARAMLNDDLYSRFPKPDFALALHDYPVEAGKVGIHPGFVMASATSVEILIRGVGGHGSRPEVTKDPIVMAAELIMALQTIVSREITPFEPAVVTVGSIHGGTRGNIIPDEVRMQLTVRTYKEEVRRKIMASIERITAGIAKTGGVPDELSPLVSYADLPHTPTYNDPGLTARLKDVFKKALGEDNVLDAPPIMGSEDFGLFGLDQQIPVCMFFLGMADPADVEKSRQNGTELPGLHSPYFAPVPEPTIRTGIRAMSAAVLDLLKK